MTGPRHAGADPAIELIYDLDCPNVDGARAAIRAALESLDMPAVWVEWERGCVSTPVAVRHFGSPSVLVNGRDVDCRDADDPASSPKGANSCRIYVEDNGGLHGAPSSRAITAAILASTPRAESDKDVP